MGRAFSVFMFYLAMDPVYKYLNRIPGVINVKVYVDDCTVVGTTAGEFACLLPVRQLFNSLHDAGFQIIEHPAGYVI